MKAGRAGRARESEAPFRPQILYSECSRDLAPKNWGIWTPRKIGVGFWLRVWDSGGLCSDALGLVNRP